MSDELRSKRTSPFWDAVAGRVDPPHAAPFASPSKRVRSFSNPIGVVQGGFLAAMLDDTLGPALAPTSSPHLTR